jgi:hypothetical protein
VLGRSGWVQSSAHLLELDEAAIRCPVLEGLGAPVCGLQQHSRGRLSMHPTDTSGGTTKTDSLPSLLSLPPPGAASPSRA